MLKAYCSHCQGIERPRIVSDPEFSIRDEIWNGYPIVHVLKNGGPVHPWDSDFCFGVRKAQMMLACVPLLDKFWQGTTEERLHFGQRTVDEIAVRSVIYATVEVWPDFIREDTGEKIDLPWLFLRSYQPSKTTIGLGVWKCRAICAVRPQLKEWADRARKLQGM